MSVSDQIAYWRKAADDAPTKEAALVAFGVYVGLVLSQRAALSTTDRDRESA